MTNALNNSSKSNGTQSKNINQLADHASAIVLFVILVGIVATGTFSILLLTAILVGSVIYAVRFIPWVEYNGSEAPLLTIYLAIFGLILVL